MKIVPSRKGFTLIELSIVMVIIGLIIGSILVGQDLINAATVRSQITQIEKYQTAMNTFRGKYGDQLPGDIAAASAGQFGFPTTFDVSYPAGNGNGIIEGTEGNLDSLTGEAGLFWIDLSIASLVESSFTPCSISAYAQSPGYFDQCLPVAKIGNGAHVVVWSGGWNIFHGDNINYFSVATPLAFDPSNCGTISFSMPLTPAQAYSIDKKIDDGFPQSGNVEAFYPGCDAIWASGGPVQNSGTGENAHDAGETSSGDNSAGGPVTSSSQLTQPMAATCYDNSNQGGIEHYSLGTLSANNLNCALSFKFQ